MKKAVSFVALFAVALSLSVSAWADTTYDTTAFWNGSDSIMPFGNPNTATYGQTFIAPTDNVLQDFTFYLQGDNNVSLSIQADVFAWQGGLLGGEGGQAIGSPLFQSSSFNYTDNGLFQAEQVNTGGTVLTAGQQYVALFTVSNPSDFAASTGTVNFGAVLYSHPANDGGGGFVYYNNGNDFSALNSSTWDNGMDFGDLAWTADFSSASLPEPSAFGLLAMAVGMAGAFVRRKKA